MDEFKHMNPVKLEYCIKGYRLRQKMRDEEMWAWCGSYIMSAVSVSIDRNLRGDKAQSEYAKMPIMQMEEKKEKRGTKESNEVIATFEMKLRAKRLKELGLPESPA